MLGSNQKWKSYMKDMERKLQILNVQFRNNKTYTWHKIRMSLTERFFQHTFAYKVDKIIGDTSQKEKLYMKMN